MTREREVTIYIPVAAGAGLGGVGTMFAVLGAAVAVAAVVCIAVSCAHFRDPSSTVLPTTSGTCEPFCPATPSVAVPGGTR